MLYRPSSLKKSIVAFAAAASLLSAVPSFGQDAKPQPVASKSNEGVTAKTNCHDFKLGEVMANTRCEILKGGVLDTENASLEREHACKQLIISAAKGGKITLTAVPKPGEACRVAKDFGLT